MLTKIREKTQGVFAWIILILICVPFALWGIQNYLGGGTEKPIATVGDKHFYQPDLNRAYEQFAQSMAGLNIDEEVIKRQALDKLISDEVLWQYVQKQNLVVTDQAARDFIRSLEFLQTDGKFDKKKYKALLGSQRMSAAEFVIRIKKALAMEQMQKAIVDSGIATRADAERFFAIQNQTRDLTLIKIPLPTKISEPSEEDILAYYQQHINEFQTPEQVKIEYVELSLDQLAQQIDVTDEQLKAYYEVHKQAYSTPERRRISHILFKFNKDSAQDKDALERALKAKEQLASKDFATLAKELSDDKLTARNGGDLGLFNVGVMDKAFEEAATKLKLGEVSEPVKSAFGYHLITVTELKPATTKPFNSVKGELEKAYKRSQAEARFYELGELLAEVSYENPDNLDAAAEAVDSKIKQSDFFDKNKGTGIAEQAAIRSAAFSEDVLKGNNSEPIELGPDKLVVLRVVEHRPAQAKKLEEVKSVVIAELKNQKARQIVREKAGQIKEQLLKGRSIDEVAKEFALTVQSVKGLSRSDQKISRPVKQAVFKAAKPVSGKPTIIVTTDFDGAEVVVSLDKVNPGTLSETDKQKLKLAIRNIARAYGQLEFNAFISALKSKADISVHLNK